MPRRSFKLAKLLSEHKIDPKMGVEVGVQFGKNANFLLKEYPNLHLYLVDNYDTTKTIHANHTTEEVSKIAFKTLDKFRERVTWILKPSVIAATFVEDRSVDYVFVDATHTYEAVKEDVEAWLPKIRMGGLLTGHDFSARFRGVKRAVKERFGDKLSHVGDVWYIPVTEDIL